MNRVMELLSRAGKREGGQETDGATFASFAALDMKDENRPTLQSLNSHHRCLPRHPHHLVTADPAVLEVAPSIRHVVTCRYLLRT